jgi:hypothetical protein
MMPGHRQIARISTGTGREAGADSYKRNDVRAQADTRETMPKHRQKEAKGLPGTYRNKTNVVRKQKGL